MNVPSFDFIGFAAIVALAINLSRARRWRRAVLLVANLAFLATLSHDPRALFPFTGLLILGFVGLRIVESDKRRAVFVVLLLSEIGAFSWLKHYAFVPHDLLLHEAYFTVGMSYVFFRILHLLIDGYQGTLPDRVPTLSYINYTLNFTALVAGPIQFYRDYLATESNEPLSLNAAAVGAGTKRIAVGFFKVAVAAPIALYCHNFILTDIAARSPVFGPGVDVASLISAYPVYLYLNFSGYTDVVIGVARFLRLALPENFDKPYAARSFIDLWSRWHMTLSTWLRTYVYSPLLLASMRRFPSPSVEPMLGVVAYFVTFFLVGAWHGQTTMFLFFGLLQGLGVSVNKSYQIAMIRWLGRRPYRALCDNTAYEAASRGLTFTYFGWTILWFWSTWTQLDAFVARIGLPETLVGIALAFITSAVALTSCDRVARALKGNALSLDGLGRSTYVQTAYVTALLAIVLSVTVVLAAPAPRIVYRGF